MNQAQVDYAALRFKSAKDLSSVANDIKSGRVAVETVYVQRLGKRIMKFRCPPGTRRGGQWTDRLGTDCNLGPARAGLAKITRTVSRLDNALDEAEKRKLSGGPGLVRYQAGRAAERAGEVVDYAAQRTREGVGRAIERTGEAIDNTADAIRKRGQATRVRMGRALEAAGEAIDRAAERLGEAYERTKERVGVALERAGEAWDDRADRRRVQQAADEAGKLLTADQKARAIEDLADQLHEAWRQTRKNPDGTYEPRLKDDGNGGQVDIANTRYKDLPEKWQAENKAAATHVIDAIDNNPNASDDEIAAMVHEGWLERNGEWAPDELKVDYADLPQDEKDKDLAIVEQARANIAKQKAASTAKKPDAQKPTAGPAKTPKKKTPKTVDPEKAQAELEKLQPNLKKPKPEEAAPEAESVTPEDTFVPAPTDADMPDAPEGDTSEADAPVEEVDAFVPAPSDDADVFVPAPPDASLDDLPEIDKQPIPEPDSGKVPTAERTVIKKPEEGKKPSGPAKAAGASLDDANAKNAKKTKKNLPGKKYGTQFKNAESAKQAAFLAALDYGVDMYVAELPNGKYQIVDEERFKALGLKAAYAFNKNGGLIELEEPEASTTEQIIAEVEHANLLEETAAVAEAAELNVPTGSLDLKKSKTGAFLPDDFSRETLGYGKTAFAGSTAEMIAFENAWDKQQEDVLNFWEKRVGSILDPYEGLNAIDAYIGEEKAKPDANPGKIGVLNAERNNYLAMLVPDTAGEDAFVDPYSRINFVGPKRRMMIIEDAGLQEHLVSKSKSKSKKLTKNATSESANDALAPVDAPEVDLTPAQEETLTPDPQKSATALLAQIMNGIAQPDPQKVDQAVKNMSVFDYMMFRGTDGELSLEKVDDSINSHKAHLRELQNEMMETLAKGGYANGDSAVAAKGHVEHIEALEKIKAEISALLSAKGKKDIEDDENGPDLDMSTPEVDTSAFDLRLSNFEKSETRKNYQKAIADILHQENPSVPNFNTEEELNDWFDAQIIAASLLSDEPKAKLEEMKKAGEKPSLKEMSDALDKADVHTKYWEDRKAEALAAFKQENTTALADMALNLSKGTPQTVYVVQDDGEIHSIPVNLVGSDQFKAQIAKAADGAIYFEGEKYDADKYLESLQYLTVPEPLPVEVTPTVSAETLPKVGNAATLSALFDSVPEFNFTMISNAEGSKLGSTLETILSRLNSKQHYVNKIDDVLANLPANIGEMTPEQQVEAIAQAAGVSKLQAAKEIARSTFHNQYGKRMSLVGMRDAINSLTSGGQPSSVDADKMLATAKSELAAAQDQLASLPSNIADPVRLHYVGAVNDAKAKVVEAAAIKHHQIKITDPSNMKALSDSYMELNSAVDSLDEKIRVGLEKQINNGFAVEAGSPDVLSAKGFIKTSGFDSTVAGTMQPDGKAIAYSIPLGNKGMFSAPDAAKHLAGGGKISDVPDDLLNEAIRDNIGANKRFVPVTGAITGYNETIQFVDSLDGRRYVIKAAHRNHMEHIQEVAGARLGQILGEPMVGIRFASAPYSDSKLPAPQKAAEGVSAGLQRAIVLDTVHNMFKGEDYTVYDSLHDVPAGAQYDGESLARMMVLDRSMNYFDRTAANMIPVKGPDGKIHLHPIDSGNGFRGFEGGSEQAAGFVKKTKSDNVDLMALVKKLSPEERQKWAAALTDSVRRYKKADFAKEFGEIADVMKVSDPERERLAKHAAFLEAKKTALDWDQMTRNALGGAGLSDQEIEDLINPPLPSAAYKRFDGLVVPQETMTVGNPKLGKQIDNMNLGALATSFTYDGGDVRRFEVRASKVDFQSDKLGISKETPSVMLEFKRTGKAAAVVPSVESGWTLIGGGHQVPAMQDGISAPTFNLTGFGTELLGTGSMTQWAKKLDDGTVVLVTTGSKKNSADNIARIIIPGESAAQALDPDRVENAMKALGVTQHGLPTKDQLEKYALSASVRVLTGKNSGSKPSLIAELQQHGLSMSNLRSYLDADGVLRVEFDDTALQKIKELSGNVSVIYHSLNYGSGGETAVINSIIDGKISSSTRRFNHGIPKGGGSTSSDVGAHGSGDFLFTYRKYGIPMDSIHPDEMHFYTPVEVAYRRTDWYALGATHGHYHGDHYGEISHIGGVQKGHTGKTTMESMFDQGLDVTKGLMVVPQSSLSSIISKLKLRGVETVGGIPIEDIVVTPSNFTEKLALLRERLAAEGITF